MNWAPCNVTADTIRRLHAIAPGYRSWWIYFGVIEPIAILEARDMTTGHQMNAWRSIEPFSDIPGVRPSRRAAWHKRLLKRVARAQRDAKSERINGSR
jgi:hypothetical protein